MNLAELAGKGRYYVHNGVGVVAACEVTAARRTVEADRTPFMAREAAERLDLHNVNQEEK